MNTVIPKETWSFLKALDQNNNKVWFEENKPLFKTIESKVKEFGYAVENAMNEHDQISKTKLFRIYRDVRFSKDKTPYKTHFGIAFTRKKPALRGGYYIHLKPGNSFIATGFWNPNKEDLFRIRKEFELDAAEFRSLSNEKTFLNAWGSLQGDEVIVAPKGFYKDDPNIDLIKKKQFIFVHQYADEEVLSATFIKDINQRFQAIRPFFDYMSEVLTTDLNGISLL